MALKFKIAKLEEVEEQFRGLYVKNSDGGYSLEVDGGVDADRLKEFRETNVRLMKEAERFKDLNPEKYQELMELQRQREEKELIDKGEVDKVVQGRVEAMKKEYETQVQALTGTNTAMTRQLEMLMIDNTVRTAATKIGIRPEAVDDVLLRSKQVFSIKEGKVVALDAEGKIVYGKDGTTPLGIEEWSGGLKATAPHLYLDSKGAGAGGSGGGGRMGDPKAHGVSKISRGLDNAQFD